MIKNYFQVAFRSISKSKLISLINITGLGLAIGCCIPFYHIIRYETSFDHFHERADRIYRVILDWAERADSGHVHYPAADALQTEFADFEQITRVHGPVSGKISIDHDNGQKDFFIEKKILFADQFFLKTFNFTSITSVNPTTLQKPNEVLLTASLARKYFADLDPIGKSISINDETQLQVVGLLADPPQNTNSPFSMIISYSTFDQKNKERDGWLFAGDVTVYVTLRKDDNPEKFHKRLEDFTEQHVAYYKKGMYNYSLQPLKEIHTSAGFGYDVNYYAPTEMIWMPVFLGFLIIIIACINFINLSTAQSLGLAKEANIRKAIGSSRVQLLIRLLLQTAIIVSIALMVGLLLGYFILKEVNQLFSVVDYHLTINATTILFISLLGLLILAMGGTFPALFLINQKPTNVFRGNVQSGGNRSFAYLGKGLIVFQIGASFVLLIASIVITAQINSWRRTDLKFRTADIVSIQIPRTGIGQKESFKHLLQSEAGVQQITFSSGSPLNGYMGAAKVSGTIHYQDCKIHFIDENYLEAFRIKLSAGNANIDPDRTSALINQKLASTLGFLKPEDAIGNKLEVDILMGDHLITTISGVVEDYINSNPTNASISPSVLLLNPEKTSEVNVALNNHVSFDILERIQGIFKQVYPNEIFTHQLMISQIEEGYIEESLIQKAVRFIAGISILISCFGIVGIINFMALRRRKEFSVRKVNGASSNDIVKLIAMEFSFLIVIGFLTGAPIAAWLLHNWLQKYPQHIRLHIGYFVTALFVIVGVLTMIVLFQVRKISRVNPAEILKGE